MRLKFIDSYLKTDSEYLLNNGSWIFFSQAVMLVFSFISAYVFANYISLEDYGTYKYILGILGLCGLFTLIGIDTAVIEGVARSEKGSFRTGLIHKIKWGTLGTIAAIIIGIYYYIQGNAQLGYTFFFTAFSVPFFQSLQLWKAYLVAKKDFRRNSLIGLLTQIIILIATTITLYISNDIYLTLSVFLVSHITANIFAQRVTKFYYDDLYETGVALNTLRFGNRLSITKFFSYGVSQADNIILWHFLGPVAVAQFAFAQAMQTMTQKAFKSILNLAYPKFVNRSTEEITKSIRTKVVKSVIILIPVTLIYILLLPVIFKLFFPQYLDSVIYAQVLGIMIAFTPTKLYGIGLLSRKRKKSIYISTFLDPLIRLIALLVCIPLFGIWGAVLAIYINMIFSSGLVFYLFSKATE